jgi:protein involved in polysaccharide export with SLBB domain
MSVWAKEILRFRTLAAIVCVCVVGCTTSPNSESAGKSDRYRPDVNDRNVSAGEASNPVQGTVETSQSEGRTPNAENAPILRRGDEVLVSLKDIPKEDEFSESVDDRGQITFPLLGNVKVEGRSTAEAERMVELAYVRLGYYKKITVVMRKQDDKFYIMGEVNVEGPLMISGDVSLSQAVAMARGLTDFADPTKVQVNRHGKILKFNLKEIQKQKASDPLVFPGDTIYVPRGFL